MNLSCALTGHREIGEDFNFSGLETAIKSLAENGVKTFYCGMAVGFDLIAAECVISFKNELGLKLAACIPCATQPKYYSEVDKLRYERILNECDEKFVLAPSYFKGCMQERDKFMVDKADVVLAYLKKKKGGTYFTVSYAKKQCKEIVLL